MYFNTKKWNFKKRLNQGREDRWHEAWELTKSVKEQSDNAAQIDEVKGKLSTACQDLVYEKRKVSQTQSSLSKILKELEFMQPMIQDTKKLKEMATTICNKYVSGNAAIHEEEDTMDKMRL